MAVDVWRVSELGLNEIGDTAMITPFDISPLSL